MTERRRFSRIIYQAPATLSQGEVSVVGNVNDLSLHGLLLRADDAEKLTLGKAVNVSFTLPESDITIALVGNLISNEKHAVRLSIDHIDIESIGHLKRLVELNVGDDSLLHREIEHLSDLGEHH
ncbi:PilZ domain-containing protein [Vibrio sonorensis]|uniref:PilZ domain-containing protein n=1 Tax=Vibrio sonorensis TaxID=1004316 RepID=UPI0008D9C3AC|nr:PilZ domain-containing protein [Vibrio sonorensis]